MKKITQKVDTNGVIWDYYEDALERVLTFRNGALYDITENMKSIRFFDDQRTPQIMHF